MEMSTVRKALLNMASNSEKDYGDFINFAIPRADESIEKCGNAKHSWLEQNAQTLCGRKCIDFMDMLANVSVLSVDEFGGWSKLCNIWIQGCNIKCFG